MRRVASIALLVVGTVGLVATPGWGFELYRDDERDIRVAIDTTVSIGVSVRTEERDPKLIWIGHGGTNTDAASINGDDGNLNYSQWDVFSTLAKATSEVEATWGQYGAFLRVMGFWDPIADCNNPGAGAPTVGSWPEDSPGFNAPQCFRRSQLDSKARSRKSPFEGGVVGAQFRVFDLYGEGSWDLFDRPLHLRVGNQLISWGEGFFYQGINQINQVDVTRLRVPGSEIKEALVPAPMVRFQADLFENLSVDAYYQFWWFRTDLDPTGSYFSSSELVARGASLPASGDGRTQGLFQPNVIGGLFGPADPGATGLAPEQLIFTPSPFARVRGVPKAFTEEARNQGQGGVALRYFLEQAQTELGAYYIHYHSKSPAVGFHAYGIPEVPGFIQATNAPWDYFTQYAEDVDLVGLSFATEFLSAAFSGEVSYRPNDPVPINAVVGPALTPDFGPNLGGTLTRLDGFVREHRFQFIANVLASFARGTRWIGPVVGWIGANDISFIAEWGLVLYPWLDRSCVPSGDFVARVSTIQTGCTPYQGPAATPQTVDEVSWGYQLRIGPTWFNPFGLPIRFLPFVSWQHDVSGNTPGLNPYIGKRMAVDVGFEAIYLDSYAVRLSYANFFGGGARNALNDRDFLSFSISYSF